MLVASLGDLNFSQKLLVVGVLLSCSFTNLGDGVYSSRE